MDERRVDCVMRESWLFNKIILATLQIRAYQFNASLQVKNLTAQI